MKKTLSAVRLTLSEFNFSFDGLPSHSDFAHGLWKLPYAETDKTHLER